MIRSKLFTIVFVAGGTTRVERSTSDGTLAADSLQGHTEVTPWK